MAKNNNKPTPEAKALSLYLMAFKSTNPVLKEEAKRVNRLWDQVGANELTRAEYAEKVQKLLTAHGGYEAVIEKTVNYYIEKTGEWTLKGEDKYCKDAKAIADKIKV